MGLGVQDLLWLLLPLLPLAAASGWYASRRDQRLNSTRRDKGLSSDYFRGINFLLNEQPDKAIEVFTRMLEVNTETVETHLALGSLFRRRGEVERAIRIHQNLIARPTLDKAQRALALCELAQDYFKAGLLDRAESLFLELSEIPAHTEQALRSLMNIYEQEREWDNAIASGRRLGQKNRRTLWPVIAQYHCEIAEAAMKEGHAAIAHREIEKALSNDAQCVRASIIAGRLAAQEGSYRDAIAAWQKVERQDAAYLDEVMDEIADAYRRLGDEDGLYHYLQAVVRRQPGMRALFMLVEAVQAHDGADAAQALLADQLTRFPSMPGLQRLVDLQMMLSEPEHRDELQPVKRAIDHLVAQQQGHQCNQCGFRGQSLHWQCPACHAWMSMQPLTGTHGLANTEGAPQAKANVDRTPRIRA